MPTRFSKTRKHRGHVSAGHGRVGKHRKHPGGRGLAGGQHHHRTNFDKYHPGYFGKVGMRHYHLTRNAYWRPIINVDKLWTLVPEEEKQGLTEDSEVVPVIDTLRHGYGKVLGNGQLPKLPFIVKARFVSKKAEPSVFARRRHFSSSSCVAMSFISAWYQGQYSTWNRTRHIQSPPFLARTDTLTSRTAIAMARAGARDAVAINMGSGDPNMPKKQETLFGPNIGVIHAAPSWAHPPAKQTTADSLTPDILKAWIEKSKEPSQPTTTLQALVNLKRPTLRLVPLTAVSDEDPANADAPHHHGLEFEYDCDAPKCRINVDVILPADHPQAENVDSRGFSRIPVYEAVFDGGFGKVLKLDEGATLELGRFEQAPSNNNNEASPLRTPTSSDQPYHAGPSEGGDSTAHDNAHHDRSRKRFSAFPFRKRAAARAVSGPALAVVDADHAHPAEDAKEKEAKDDVKDGVRVTIRLSALDEDGIDTAVNNEQVTYLHVVRLGAQPAEAEDDTRPWVVRVIKRDAIIGPYVFQLHEIYGLSSGSAAPPQPRTHADAHQYPPTAAPVLEEGPSSECLVCLSSPREVILLPCRHLVACKECAINMVEFAYTSLLRISTTPPTKDISDDDQRTSIDNEDAEGSDLEHENEHDQPSLGHHSVESAAPSAASAGMLGTLRSNLRRNLRVENDSLPPDVERSAASAPPPAA
ncbi:hypothetical protein ID866_2712 [Astraeus odoratus]|nr:hypothetical protein ID866_2712 [Astraeus odoratus]